MTANVGRIGVEPGGANVVPGRADFTIDVRSPSASGFHELDRLVRDTVLGVAAEEGLTVELEQTFVLEPQPLDPELVALLQRAAAREGAPTRLMPSGAGHDAMIVGRHVPAALLFVPSRRGISHSPDEESRPEDVELGMRVLAAALRAALEHR
jgi:acetylornithine deacetylase/succinyl-diaminopimelate desuccinylase-like protein